jgi:hypothetical protein
MAESLDGGMDGWRPTVRKFDLRRQSRVVPGNWGRAKSEHYDRAQPKYSRRTLRNGGTGKSNQSAPKAYATLSTTRRRCAG